MAITANPVRARYLGDQRAEIQSESRRFIVGPRAQSSRGDNLGREGSQFCPIELITASYAS